ncbi:MAG: hypothetical protein WEA61_08780 [Anaerolineales bacterium]
MAQKPQNNFGSLLSVAILLLALGLRFVGLGDAPLTEYEAGAALAAHDVASGEATEFGPQPAYALLTNLPFRIFGESEILARFLPAIVGLALVALPFFWRDLLGDKVALVLSFSLAIDPGLVAISRLASGRILAVAAVLFAVTAWRYRRPVLTGILAALALLAAPTIYFGLGAALLTAIVLRWQPPLKQEDVRIGGLALLITLVLGGTLLFTGTAGLAGAISVLSGFVLGQVAIPGEGLAVVLLALLAYSLPAIIFGTMGAARAWEVGDRLGKALSIFAAFSLLLVLLNPNRQVADLVWVILPLWVLSASLIARYLTLPREELLVAIAEAALMLLLAVYLAMALLDAIRESQFVLDGGWLRGLLVLGVLGFAGLATLLIGLGWSQRGALQGLVWAAALISSLWLVAASTRFARIDATSANDLWSPGPATGSMGILEATLNDVEFFQQGQEQPLSVDVQIDSAAVRWALRDYSSLNLDGITSAMAVTPWTGEVPAEFAGYRGQSFAANIRRVWNPLPPDVLAWFFLRQGPTQPELMALWVRADLFPGGDLSLQIDPQTAP